MLEIERHVENLGRKFVETDTYTIENPRYPHVRVSFTNHDGNIFSLIGTVTQAMRHAHLKHDGEENGYERIPAAEINKVLQNVNKQSNGYHEAIALLACYVTVVEFHDDDDW